MFCLLLLLLPGVRSQVPTAASLLELGNYQRHPFNTVQFVQHKPTKKGPILFPNDGPPPPPTPLIVTSRPLSESIARSELNPNNSQTAQSLLHQVTFKPEFLARSKNYKPFSYALATVTPVYNLGQQSYANDEYPVKSRKDNYDNDYEKRLMQSIHGRRDGVTRERALWEQPIQRRRTYQSSRRNAQKPMFDEEGNSMGIKVNHRSLYSREVNDDIDDDYKDNKVIYRRSNNYYSRNKVPFKKTEYQNYYNDKTKYRRRYISLENDGKPKTRPIYNINNLNANDDVNQQIPITDDVVDYKKTRKRRPFPNPENLSKYDNSIPKLRTLQSLHDNTNTIQRRPLRELDQESEETINNMHRKRSSHRFDEMSDEKDVIYKRRPVHSPEYESDNNDRIAYEHSPYAGYETEILRKDKARYIKNYRSDILQRRPTHSTDSEDIVEKRPVYSPDSRSQSEESEETNQRQVQPLYSFDRDHDNVDLKIPPKPTHFKYQQRFKTMNRRDRQPTNRNYYKTHDGDRDTSKEYNHGENYAFSYTVKDHKTGDDFSHSQQSTGSATNGEYRVRLPDGRMQIVSYTADENGYKADVKYDDQHEHDNSIDVDTSRENRYRNDGLITPYKHNIVPTYNDHFDSRDSSDREYLTHKVDIPPTYINEYSKRPTVYTNHQEFHTKNKFETPNTFALKTDFTDATTVDNLKSGELTENNNDYLEHYNDKNIDSNGNVLRTRNEDYFQFTDELPLSKEIMDYSSEFNHAYEPHRSKYSSFKPHNSGKSTVRPSYEELKDLFVPNINGRRQTPLPVASTAAPHYDITTENVVVINPKKTNLYTNIRNIAVPVTQSPLSYSTPFAVTPSGYLLSTIANLKSQVNLANKPVLSHAYINKINKYLSYK